MGERTVRAESIRENDSVVIDGICWHVDGRYVDNGHVILWLGADPHHEVRLPIEQWVTQYLPSYRS